MDKVEIRIEQRHHRWSPAGSEVEIEETQLIFKVDGKIVGRHSLEYFDHTASKK